VAASTALSEFIAGAAKEVTIAVAAALVEADGAHDR